MVNMNKDELTFGTYIKQKRLSLNKKMKELAEEVGITAAYLCDLEKGNRNAPEERLDEFIKALDIAGTELDVFYDLVGKNRKNNFPDLAEYIGNTEMARTALRKARDKNLPDSFWQNIIDGIDDTSWLYEKEGVFNVV